ncbi:MAG: polysaccharide deacetylase family protein [Desulfobacteraceae bacterium]|nr:polysaccharide deacetylase family protein [Desulfobacteraceae bacterium]
MGHTRKTGRWIISSLVSLLLLGVLYLTIAGCPTKEEVKKAIGIGAASVKEQKDTKTEQADKPALTEEPKDKKIHQIESYLPLRAKKDEKEIQSSDKDKELLQKPEDKALPQYNLSEFKGILTFDDGPHPRTTPGIIKILKSAGIKNAIFFFVGYRIIEYPDLVKQTHKAGFQIGYHSMYHQNLVHLTPNQIADDIKKFKTALNSALGKKYPLRIGRPPFGGMTSKTVKKFFKMEKDSTLAKTSLNPAFNRKFVHQKIINVFLKNNWKLLLWNVDFDDWEKPIDMNHIDETYEPGKKQVFLLHEMPVYGSTLTIYDNKIEHILPEFLKHISDIDDEGSDR